MITNEVQYRNTQAHLARFEEAVANLTAELPAPKDRKLHQLQIDAAQAQADDLRAEIADYETLRSGQVTTFEAASLQELADTLIKARIARGWTQRRLADELGVAEQQVQRYESTGYASASLARLCDVVAALGLDVHEVVTLGRIDAA